MSSENSKSWFEEHKRRKLWKLSPWMTELEKRGLDEDTLTALALLFSYRDTPEQWLRNPLYCAKFLEEELPSFKTVYGWLAERVREDYLLLLRYPVNEIDKIHFDVGYSVWGIGSALLTFVTFVGCGCLFEIEGESEPEELDMEVEDESYEKIYWGYARWHYIPVAKLLIFDPFGEMSWMKHEDRAKAEAQKIVYFVMEMIQKYGGLEGLKEYFETHTCPDEVYFSEDGEVVHVEGEKVSDVTDLLDYLVPSNPFNRITFETTMKFFDVPGWAWVEEEIYMWETSQYG